MAQGLGFLGLGFRVECDAGGPDPVLFLTVP